MNYKTIYSSRRTLAIEITCDCEIIVRAPYKTSKKLIEDFVIKHESWISSHLKKRINQKELHPEPSEEEIKELMLRAVSIIPKKVSHFSEIMNVIPAKVSINHAKTRFGSCSSKGNLNFSCRLMMYPEECIDYVVVHELAHLKHLNHSKDFWKFVEKFMPDYKKRKKLLK